MQITAENDVAKGADRAGNMIVRFGIPLEHGTAEQ